MFELSTVPFLRITLSLALGIAIALFGLHAPISLFFWLSISFLALVLVGFGIFLYRKNSNSILPGAALLLSFVIFGFLIGYQAQAVFNQDFFTKQPSHRKYKLLYLKVEEELTEKQNTWRSPASVFQAIDSSGALYKVSGKILVYWPKKSHRQKPKVSYGDILLIPEISMQMPSAAFPQDFDFKAVMRYRNMQHQVFLRENSWQTAGNSGSFLLKASFWLRESLVSNINSKFPPRIAALLESLLIGFKDDVPAEDLKAFAVSGTMHVLAVSGMHVGLLYIILLFLLTGKKQASRNPIWRGILIILVLWSFAIITGLSASVIRAALMFTIVEVGRSFFHRESNIVNSLFAAAFIQLLLNPLQLVDVGFQLSYLAVLGIVVIYPWLNRLWLPPTKVLQFFYQSALISLAATIATFPVTMYFFGVFPLWFLPANMAIVPLSTVLIISGLVTLALGFVPYVSIVLIWITKSLSVALLFVTHFFSNLPAASLKGFQPDELEVVLLMLAFLGLVLYFVYQLKNALRFSAFFAICIGIWGLFRNQAIRNSNELVFCELKGRVIALVRVGNSATIYTKSLPSSSVDSLYKFMLPYVSKHKITRVDWRIADNKVFKHGSLIFHAAYPISKVIDSKGSVQFSILWDRSLYSYPIERTPHTRVVATYHPLKLNSPGNKVLLLKNNFFLQYF